ncbi:MAG: Gfo/Idh/MocA family oxidoreductase [Pseudomonadota bacterium]
MTRALLIGAGMVAGMHVDAIRTSDRVALAGIVARRPEQAEALGTNAPVHRTLGRALKAGGVDFAVLTTPPDTRRAFIKPLSEAGIPILCEKPIERDYRRAARLVDLCDAAGVAFGAVLQHRMRPAAQDLIARVRNGDLGDIGALEVRIPWWREQSYYAAPGRGTYARDGGGVLITQAIHTLDLMLALAGPVTRVQAITATTPLHDLEAEDMAAAALAFENGAVGSLMATTACYPGAAEEITLMGTRGSATLSAAHLTLRPMGGPEEVIGAASGSGGGADPMAFTSDWHRAVIEDFADAITMRRAPAIPARDALAAQALIDAIRRSARGRQAITPEDRR